MNAKNRLKPIPRDNHVKMANNGSGKHIAGSIPQNLSYKSTYIKTK